ncbi:hypothetical protein JYB87_03350 [Shewanella avicenniae]|uniref:Uncharacterized protein n=1 Tax=Shewanella avicenniae TaxID=2814294 RepID=A0ABX7QS69_9GAMM|nr:hypothetical protein [Shewanella avicenniae]QSX34302.1 hypothetical protein JYB87_03350 [Shewanella avicenniae]
MTRLSEAETLENLLPELQRLPLSSYDLARYLFSKLALANLSAQVWEIKLADATRHHFALQHHEAWLDCGADNAAQATPMVLGADTVVEPLKLLEVAALSEAQLQFMCIQSAHFDHCY